MKSAFRMAVLLTVIALVAVGAEARAKRIVVPQVSVAVKEDPAAGLLLLSVSDDGDGLVPEFAQVAADQYTTSRSTRQVGLGLAVSNGRRDVSDC